MTLQTKVSSITMQTRISAFFVKWLLFVDAPSKLGGSFLNVLFFEKKEVDMQKKVQFVVEI